MLTKLLLDSGNIAEYQTIQALAKEKGSEIWGSTTNPSLIAKALAGKRVTPHEAFSVLQKEIVMGILQIVPGAVSAEVYASKDTTSEEMVEQGKEIATWDKRIVVKLPTTLEGFKARTELRKLGICINNTLVFSQEQVYAIALHEKLMQETYGKPLTDWPCFVSPFVGRLDDIGLDGMSFVNHSMNMLKTNFGEHIVWMLEASIRSLTHLKAGIAMDVELTTAPAKVYTDWFTMTDAELANIPISNPLLQMIPDWKIPSELKTIKTIEEFMEALGSGLLTINHQLTDKGIEKFVADWQTILDDPSGSSSATDTKMP